jgi:hypothetical protein
MSRRRQLNSRHNAAPPPSSYTTTRTGFDAESGLMYTETASTASTASTALPPSRPWATISRGSTTALKNFKNPNGAASMADMLWRVILLNRNSLTAENLSEVPWALGERLWKKIQQQYVQVFRIFSGSVPPTLVHMHGDIYMCIYIQYVVCLSGLAETTNDPQQNFYSMLISKPLRLYPNAILR